jgi:hypothetical protein
VPIASDLAGDGAIPTTKNVMTTAVCKKADLQLALEMRR